MFKEHPIFIPPPNPEQIIWRYLDFTKFVDLLNTASLYFTRTDFFEDIFEGSIPKKTVEWRDNQEWQNILANPGYVPINWSKHFFSQRKEIAINCWHMNDHESEAMWKLYLQSNEGIAIQSKYSLLKGSFDDTGISIHIGQIKYIDYKTEEFALGNGFNPLLHKRKSFEHEKELRALMWDKELENQNVVDLSLGGMKVPVKLSILIEKVYISPQSPAWFFDLVNTVISKFGYNFQVLKSNLIDKPTY